MIGRLRMCHPEEGGYCVFPPLLQRHSAALYQNGNDKSPKHYVWEEDEKQSKSAPSHSVYPPLPLLLSTLVGFKSLIRLKNLQGCWQTPPPAQPRPHPPNSILINVPFLSLSKFLRLVLRPSRCSGGRCQQEQVAIRRGRGLSMWSLHVLPTSCRGSLQDSWELTCVPCCAQVSVDGCLSLCGPAIKCRLVKYVTLGYSSASADIENE